MGHPYAHAEPPSWDSAGQPTNLAAAAADAGEWLALIERLVASGAWKFGQPDSMERLRGCRAQLARLLPGPARVAPEHQATVDAMVADAEARQAAEVERDAARYRWLRKHASRRQIPGRRLRYERGSIHVWRCDEPDEYTVLHGDTLDEAVDAAMRRVPGGA